MSDLRALVTYSPSPNFDLSLAPEYQDAVTHFKRGAVQVATLLNSGAIEPDGLDATSPEVLAAVTTFIQWVRSYPTAEWQQGVPLPSDVIHAVAGRNNRPLDRARRACLILKQAGNRRRGEHSTYILSRPHYLGLAALLSAGAAYQAAEAARAMEDAASRLDFADSLESALNARLYGGNEALAAPNAQKRIGG